VRHGIESRDKLVASLLEGILVQIDESAGTLDRESRQRAKSRRGVETSANVICQPNLWNRRLAVPTPEPKSR
jgi:hypothetical protein